MTWRPFIIWGWVIILTLMNHVHWCSQCQNMTLIYHPWRGGNDESSFSGGGGPASWRPFIIWGWVIILTPMNHVHWCSLFQNMTFIYHPWRGGNDKSSFSGVGDPRHDAHSSSEDESSSWCSCIMYIDAPSVKTWHSFITHGEGAMMSHHFLGEGTRVMTPIYHLRLSHHSDAHESCTLMLPVSKHDVHLLPMERGQWWVIIFWERGTRVMTPIHHLRMSHHPDDTKFKIWCQYSKTLDNI